MKQMLFVFNPRSGKEQIRGSLLRILDIFTKDGYDIHVHVTQSQGDASRIVKELGEGMDLILCSGGDGTLNETICGMLALKAQPPLGYIPAGSTNDFAVSLQIPKEDLLVGIDGVDHHVHQGIGILYILPVSALLQRWPMLPPRIERICWAIRPICWRP